MNPLNPGRCGAGAQQPAASSDGDMSALAASAGIGPGRRPFGEDEPWNRCQCCGVWMPESQIGRHGNELPSTVDRRDTDMIALRKSGKTLKEIGDQYGMTRERVRQILNKVSPETNQTTISNRIMANAEKKAETKAAQKLARDTAETERYAPAIKAYLAGATLAQVGALCGLRGPHYVINRMKKLGVYYRRYAGRPISSSHQIPAQAGDAARTSSSQDRAVNLVGDAASCASPTLFDDAATRAAR